MALSAYQVQYKRRLKKALTLRARADRQSRALAVRLADALALGETAADHIDRINTQYGTATSSRTSLVASYHQAGTAASLTAATTASVAGTPAAEYVAIADGNGGAAYAANDLD